jgi:complement component 1 Q subcomponent-binding protein
MKIFSSLLKRNFRYSNNLLKKNVFPFSAMLNSKTFETVISELKKNYEPLSENDKNEFLSKNRFVIIDKEENVDVILKKTEGDYEIELRFSSKSPEEIDKEDANIERCIDFYITIGKKDNKNGLFIEAVSVNSTIVVNQIHYSEDIKKYADNYFNVKATNEYPGPQFSVLDEKLQQEFSDVLNEFGITDDLGSFLEAYSVDKEERLLISWLNIVKNKFL